MRPRSLAPVLLLAIACTSTPSTERAPDGGGADGPTTTRPDAAAIDPPVGRVRVMALSAPGVVDDASAWFIVHDRDGRPWSVTAPAEYGAWTTLDVPAGAMVTILRRDFLGTPERTTFLDVEPGDDLVPATPPSPGSPSALLIVRFPRLSADVRQYHVELAGGCAGTRSFADDPPPDIIEAGVDLTTGCTHDADELLVVSAIDAAGNVVGTIHADGLLGTRIDLSARPWVTPAVVDLGVAHVPAGPGAAPGPVNGDRQLCLRAWAADPVLARPLLDVPTVTGSVSDGTCTIIPSYVTGMVAHVAVPDGAPVFWQQSARVRTYDHNLLFEDVRLSADPSAQLDLGWTAGPSLAVAVDPAPEGPEIQLTGDRDYLGGVTTVRWGGDNYTGFWTIVHPRAASFRLPSLPDDFAVFRLPVAPLFAETRAYLPGQFATYAAFRTGILPPFAMRPMEQRSLRVRSDGG